MEFTFAHVLMLITILGLLAFFAYYLRLSQPRRGTTEWIDREVNKSCFRYTFTLYKMEKTDIFPLVILLVVFSFVSFFKLGDMDAPYSYYRFTEEKNSVTIQLPEETTVTQMMAYTGLYVGNYTLWHSLDGKEWTQIELPDVEIQEDDDRESEKKYPLEQSYADLFKWMYIDIGEPFTANYIFLGATNTPIELGELAIYDDSGNLVAGLTAKRLFDEQDTVPEEGPTYLNGMYFDEIYHGRAAMETLRGVYPYETVHPPLGKTFIAVGVALFNMTPFGWRFAGTLCGIAMLAALYWLLKNMFGKTFISVCGTLLFGFEFMRYVQTRIATVDSFPVFFIIAPFFFMYRFLTTSADRPLRETLRPLGFSGLFFGIGVATKWIVIYAGIGLFVMYVVKIITDYRYYYAPENLGGYTERVVKTLAFTALTFIVIPVIIYFLSYIPYGWALGMGKGMLLKLEFYKMVVNVQLGTFRYHSGLVATHPYSSWWYQWIIDQRPILYYLDYFDDGTRSAFAAFGNPVVWWGGLLGIIAMIYRAIRYKDVRALVIVIGYFAQLVPWMLVTRIVFAYHYFPSTIFLLIAIAHMFNSIYERTILPEKSKSRVLTGSGVPEQLGVCKNGRKVIIAYTAAAGVLFILFYPVLSGMPASPEYLNNFVKWMPSWPF